MNDLNERSHFCGINSIRPMAVNFEIRPNNETVGVAVKLVDVIRSYSGPEDHRKMTMSLGFLDVRKLRCMSGSTARHNHTISTHKLNCLGSLTQANISRNGMCRVFLLHVRPYLYVGGSNHPAIAL